MVRMCRICLQHVSHKVDLVVCASLPYSFLSDDNMHIRRDATGSMHRGTATAIPYICIVDYLFLFFP